MSVLTVEHVTHGFGGRQILEDASFRLMKGEHIGLIGANGEGKTTFLNIITGQLTPDSGKVEWARRVKVGYLDQHASLLGTRLTAFDKPGVASEELRPLEEHLKEIYSGYVMQTQRDDHHTAVAASQPQVFDGQAVKTPQPGTGTAPRSNTKSRAAASTLATGTAERAGEGSADSAPSTAAPNPASSDAGPRIELF